MNVKIEFTLDNILKISLLCFSCVTIIALFKSMALPDDQLRQKQAHIAVRAIGDELLTYAEDHSSPVQPLQEINAQTLRLSFKAPLPINPDSLSWLAWEKLSPDVTPRAIVNVLHASSEKVVYGFEVDHAAPKDIPCLGRRLPAADYYVDVSFDQPKPKLLGLHTLTVGIIGCVLVSLALFGISFFKKDLPELADHPTIQVKGMKLDLQTNQLLTRDKQIKLTDKEAHILSILFKHEGQLVSREYLTQEVWLNQGVVTSRSLDMYISRLRKKVKDLSHTEILNQRGKGYTLKVQ